MIWFFSIVGFVGMFFMQKNIEKLQADIRRLDVEKEDRA